MANKNNKKATTKLITKSLELLYMTSMTVTARELASLLRDTRGLKTELWEDMNVLELELPSLNTVDFEPLNVNFKDPSDAAFVKNRDIQTIFAITLKEPDLPIIKECFEDIIQQYSGFLCTDSTDFSPIHVGSSVKPNHASINEL